MDLKALAAAREARRKTAAESTAATPKKKPSTGTVGKRARELLNAHRSIRMAHSCALVICLWGILVNCMIFGSVKWVVLFEIAGVALARAGGGWLHRVMPEMWKDGDEPTAEDIAKLASAGLFSVEGVKQFHESVPLEYKVLLENLAFACTYGKRNCLTNAMYTGEITLGKIIGLVWGKINQGVVRCN